MTHPRSLTPLKAQPLKGRAQEARDADLAHRLTQAWGLVVGPALVKRTTLLRVKEGRLLIGCWPPEMAVALRESAAAVWPEVRGRVQRLLGARIAGFEIVPCDPPEEETTPQPVADPFKALLARYRELGKRNDPAG